MAWRSTRTRRKIFISTQLLADVAMRSRVHVEQFALVIRIVFQLPLTFAEALRLLLTFRLGLGIDEGLLRFSFCLGREGVHGIEERQSGLVGLRGYLCEVLPFWS